MDRVGTAFHGARSKLEWLMSFVIGSGSRILFLHNLKMICVQLKTELSCHQTCVDSKSAANLRSTDNEALYFANQHHIVTIFSKFLT